MTKLNIPRRSKYLEPTKRKVTVYEPEAFMIGPFLVTSRHLMGLLIEHINKCQGASLTVEQFRVKENQNEQNDKRPDNQTQTPT